MGLPSDATVAATTPVSRAPSVAPLGSTTPVQSPYLEVIVPAINEETRLVPSLRRIARYLAAQAYVGAIAVVDNGSTDRTAELALSCADLGVPLRLLGCARPGKGAAVRRGVLTSSAPFVGFSDADLATPIETLDAVLPALEHGSQVVIASRRCPGAKYAQRQPWSRRLASYAFRSAARACAREVASVSDTQCGFKFFDRSAAQALFRASRATGFAFDIEILALAHLAGYAITEVPARWQHQEGSKLSIGREANRVFTELMWVRQNLKGQPSFGVGDEVPIEGVLA
ncbi:MAG TPA: dolichyl-phosphate beta-glucosyltransferase [Solirubrobacteraceae bacterium]|nr:dolichyl-phosphate beta-glucosyltransferase [Solirubrobacteraceae bacterium]